VKAKTPYKNKSASNLFQIYFIISIQNLLYEAIRDFREATPGMRLILAS